MNEISTKSSLYIEVRIEILVRKDALFKIVTAGYNLGFVCARHKIILI